MNTDVLLHPHIHDSEALHDFLDALSDQIPAIERDIAKLKGAPADKMLIANLFRALHTVKGDAAMCKVELAVMITHPIESLLDRLRSGEIGFSEPMAEAILLAMDRLELAARALADGEPIEHLKLVELVGGFEQLAVAPVEALDDRAAQVIRAVTGFRMSSRPVSAKAKPGGASRPESAAADLRFFRSLALQYEARSPLFQGRSDRQLHLALETNAAAGTPVDPLQLEAAVYMHDVGMLFLPESVWLKAGKLSDKERRQLQQHAGFGAGLLQRMEGWAGAAEIVLQHHERQDGAGYPRGFRSEDIVPGAKILAMVDTFESVTLKHSQRGQGRSLVRAIAEINAGDNQFAPEWIGPFNTVIRRMIEG
ncbi:MAG TPA: HD domain-containing phosphohydrolase [Novimethylophilus sp.]|jgi:HPt (histidine-containing phosphotransfer) domain-containing protein|uniref:HD-GYP domain-containing protein n=1 Tax=Novimethylophilus sp. TaxID=2137426 RepID=UPI002F412B55